MSRPFLWMLVGVPCSGKSTWIERGLPDEGRGRDTTILSTDYYIECIAKDRGKTYNEVFHDVIKDADRKLWDDLKYAIEKDHNIIWDQTNLNRKSRAKKLIMVPDQYRKVAVVFLTPDKETLAIRNNNRAGKFIPPGVLQNMIDSFVYPTLDEGFDEVLVSSETIGMRVAHA